MSYRSGKLWIVLLLLFCGLAGAQEKVTTEILESGLGVPIKAGETAVVSYKLKLKDGTLIDSRGENNPYEFKVGSTDVIPGFSQAVEGMKEHERRTAVIPPSLGYGDQDLGGIPPNSTLYYEIGLLEILHDTKPTETEHFQGDGHDHEDEENLPEKMKDLEFLKGRNARKLQRPAMFEFLIRDFFTKPWRYEKGYLKVWESTAKTAGVLVLLVVLGVLGRRKGYWA